ncbi:hypothetical protein BJY01DRAFT_251297 [Aspergillus pseudoustus]|uniref:Uncharacterized protein n=1 Tax=Aspergillus pseudoustus TaxID=1810923 RepID=A0ABR4JCM6_9EURO
MHELNLPGSQTTAESTNYLAYRFMNVRFDKALKLGEGNDTKVPLWLTQQPGTKVGHKFRISSTTGDLTIDYTFDLVRVQGPSEQTISRDHAEASKYLTGGQLWYKAQSEIGHGFGSAFQRLILVESTSGQRQASSLVSLTEPESRWGPQSYYSIQRASLDGSFQTEMPSLWAGEPSAVNAVVALSLLNELVINKVRKTVSRLPTRSIPARVILPRPRVTWPTAMCTKREGVLYVHRIVPDAAINEFKRVQRQGPDIALADLHKAKTL